MYTRGFFPGTGYIIVFSLIFLLSACGSDEAAPSIDTSAIPQTVFFNITGSTEYYLFTGRATDNTNVDSVQISVDNGMNWESATIDNDPPNHNWNVEWTYLASSGDLSAGMHTVLVRAADKDKNETTSDPVILESKSSADPAVLISVFNNATAGDVIGLSTGEGDAFGDSTSVLTIPIIADLTVLGSGYGDMMTSGGHSPNGNSMATVLDTDPATASLFSVDADLTIRSMRLLGAVHGIHLSDGGGSDPHLTVQDCVFDRQSGWSVHAQGDGGGSVEFLSSIVDASRADRSAGNGGLFLDNVKYTVYDSLFNWKSDIGPGAGVQVLEGTGIIDNCIFDENALAIWASGSAVDISSCTITGGASTTNGIDISGDAAVTTIRDNTIEDNNGYGVRIRGNSEPKFFGNIIKSNSVTYPGARGIRILDPGSHPEFGKFPYDESGCNRFESSSTIREDFIFEVDSSTLDPLVIYAGNNYWGLLFDTGNEIHTYKIHDGHDGDNSAAAEIDLTGTPGNLTPIIWNGTEDCP